jgi:heptosyltransferase III
VTPDRILVFRPGHLGDALAALPALRAIRAAHPKAALHLLTSADSGRVSSWDLLSRLGLFESAVFHRPGVLPPFARLRALSAELLYYLPAAPRSRAQVLRDRVFFRGLCGIPEARGLSPSVLRAGAREDERLLAAAGLPSAPEETLPSVAPERARVAALWRKAGLDDARAVIALAPGASTEAGRWPLERYRALASALLNALPEARLLVVGGEDASAALEPDPRVVDWSERLSVWESAEALRRCALFVGNNSGPMHLAAAAGVRCVAVCSGRDLPGIWEPRGSGHRVLYKPVACSGCGLSECDRDLRCLTEISVDEVVSACLDALPVSP